MEEPYLCYWDVHPESGIRVCTNGEVEGTTEFHHGTLTIRKNKKRYDVGRLVLETFENEEYAGNYKGRGTVVYADGNIKNRHIDNLKWEVNSDGWDEKNFKALQDVYLQAVMAIPGLEKIAEVMRKDLEKQRNTTVKFDKDEILKKLSGGC